MAPVLLDVPSIRQRALPLTVAQYHALGEQGLITEQVELLDGVVVEKMSKSPLHSSVAQKLLRKLRAAAKGNFDVRQEQPITCETSEPEPDLALVEAREDDYADGHPTTAKLVIEVAVSSAEIDRQKATIYAAAGVREYWIVLPETRQIEVHSGLLGGAYTVHRIFSEGQTAASETLPDFDVELVALFPR